MPRLWWSAASTWTWWSAPSACHGPAKHSPAIAFHGAGRQGCQPGGGGSAAGGQRGDDRQCGDDDYGRQLHRALYVEGIDCQGVSTCPGTSSGVALITVDAASQNCIVIIPGANGLLTPQSVLRFDALLQAAEVVICQLEVPTDTVACTLARARELGKQVILNPAPATGPLPADWFAHIDYLTPNESEAEALTGVAVTDQDSARRAGERLLQLGQAK